MTAGKQRCAVVSLVGLPNAGKSSLVNAMVGERIAAVHRKPQMTRKNLVGLFTAGDVQLVFTDTPGVFTPHNPLEGAMRENLDAALRDADIVMPVIDVARMLTPAVGEFYSKALTVKPGVIVLNKIDLPTADWRITAEALKDLGAKVFPVSTLTGIGLSELIAHLKEMAPLHPHCYPADDLTAANMREIASGMILEEVLEALHQEIPYQTAVVIDSYQDAPALGGDPSQDGSPSRDGGPSQNDSTSRGGHPVAITATLVVNRASQKGMVIGKGGIRIKMIGSRARKRLEAFLNCKVRLELFVKVDPDWIKNPRKICEYL